MNEENKYLKLKQSIRMMKSKASDKKWKLIKLFNKMEDIDINIKEYWKNIFSFYIKCFRITNSSTNTE